MKANLDEYNSFSMNAIIGTKNHIKVAGIIGVSRKKGRQGMKNTSGIYSYCTNCKYYEENKQVKGLELGRNGRTRNKEYIVYQWCDKDKKAMSCGVCLCEDFNPIMTFEEFKKTDDYLNKIVEIKDGVIIRARDRQQG